MIFFSFLSFVVANGWWLWLDLVPLLCCWWAWCWSLCSFNVYLKLWMQFRSHEHLLCLVIRIRNHLTSCVYVICIVNELKVVLLVHVYVCNLRLRTLRNVKYRIRVCAMCCLGLKVWCLLGCWFPLFDMKPETGGKFFE